MLSQKQLAARRTKKAFGSRRQAEMVARIKYAIDTTIMECLAEGLSLRETADACKCSHERVRTVKRMAGG